MPVAADYLQAIAHLPDGAVLRFNDVAWQEYAFDRKVVEPSDSMSTSVHLWMQLETSGLRP
jgi:hypothetical protein